MRRPKRRAFQLEPLEDRALLSHVFPRHLPLRHAALPAARSLRPISVNSTELQGNATGNYTVTPSRPGVGANYNLSGTGNVNTLGNVQVGGVITVSPVRNRTLRSGIITLSNAQGTLRIRVQGLVGPQPLAPVSVGGTPSVVSSMPLKYVILSGTGAFKNLHGNGSVSLALSPNTTVVPPVGGTGGTSNGGTSNGGQTGTGSGGTGVTFPPPIIPPITITPPGKGGGSNSGGSTLPPGRKPPTPVGGPIVIGVGNGGASRAATPAPVGGPTFLNGTFTLTFNGGPVVWPPML